MTAKTVEKGGSARQGRSPRRRAVSVSPHSAGSNLVAPLRRRLGIPRNLFSRMTGFSERAVAGWESGQAISEAGLRKIKELERFQIQLAEVVDAGTIPQWLQTPNQAFEGLTPLEVIERGQMDRLWRMIFFLESGVPG